MLPQAIKQYTSRLSIARDKCLNSQPERDYILGCVSEINADYLQGGSLVLHSSYFFDITAR